VSDTPETDAAVIAAGGDWSPVLRAVAQRLERQRDEEMRWHHRTHQELVETQCKLMDITQERDEARDELFELKKNFELNLNTAKKLFDDIERLKYERNKALDKLSHFETVVVGKENAGCKLR
jgi:hypothetical protein